MRYFRVVHLFGGWTRAQWSLWWACRPRWRDTPHQATMKKMVLACDEVWGRWR